MTAEAPALVIVDRDGVINIDSASYIRTPDQWQPLAGSLEALARLTQAGADIVVATNQSGIGRGLFTEATLARIHERMIAAVESAGGRIAGIYYCPHTPADGCGCRKPAPGLFERIAEDFGIELAGVPVIGDKRSDIEAAEAVGARPILVLTGHGRTTLSVLDRANLEHYGDLAAAVAALLAETA